MMEFKFNCFAKEDMWTSADVVWGPRIEYCILAQPPSQKCRKCMEKVRPRTKRRPAAHLFHSWIEKRSQQFVFQALSRDVQKIAKFCGNNSFATKLFLSDCGNSSIRRNAHLSEAFRIRDQFVEEPWLLQPSLFSDHFADVYNSSGIDSEREMLKESNGNNQNPQVSNQSRISENFNHKSNRDMDDKRISEPCNSLSTYYPVEEPWIFESSTPLVSSTVKMVSGLSSTESDKDEVSQLVLDEQNWSTPESLMNEEESNAMTKEESVSTVILINSSICTIQRIAVLENGKLVELLLEPVKTNVQCDSVYLGVVTKLVPHMGGAFVNIGSPRPSFMDIRTYKEPFVLTSFHDMKERELSGFEHDKSGDKMDFPENGAISNGVEEPDDVEYDQSEDEFVDDEFEGHENRTNFDVLDVINENVNGSVVGHEIEVDIERFSEQLNGEVDQLQTRSHQDSTVKVSQQQDVAVKNRGAEKNKWEHIKKGSKIIVQVVKEGLGTKGPTLTAYPKLRSRFWVLMTRCNTIGISKKIFGAERTRLRAIAKTLQPPGFGLTVRTVATGHSLEELQRDLEGLLSTWKSIMDHAKSAALAADEGVDGAVPIILHRAMGQTLSVVQDYFNETVMSMAVDSPRTYHEVTNYLQEIAPNLCERVELYSKRTPLFDEYCIEEEINNILSKRVPLANGGYLVIEQTEALVSIDVNGGLCMLGQGTSQEKAILEVNLAAAKQIARELRLRDVGGIIIVDFIDMLDDSNKRLVYEEVRNAVERDRSTVKVSELSRNGLMEITRKRVRPSVTFMISEPCTCCHATGRVEALETSFSKIEHEICRHLSTMDQKADPENPKSWPRFILNVDRHMCNYLTSGKRTRLAILSSSLKVWILLKVARGLSRGAFELKLLTDENMDKSQQDGAAISVLHPKEAVSYNSPNRKVTIFPIKKWKSGAK